MKGPKISSGYGIALAEIESALFVGLDKIGLGLDQSNESSLKSILQHDVGEMNWQEILSVCVGYDVLARNKLKRLLAGNLDEACKAIQVSDPLKYKIEDQVFKNVDELPLTCGVEFMTEFLTPDQLSPGEMLTFIVDNLPSSESKLKNIFTKNVHDLALGEISTIIGLVRKHTGEQADLEDDDEEAAGLLVMKGMMPAQYEELMEVKKSLALGVYTPGDGVFAKKHATDPYFPSR